MYYTDTVTDDARLVLRVLQEAIEAGGHALNYVKATSLLKSGGQVSGIELENAETSETVKVNCKSVINATGAWADRLRNEVNPEKRIRPLRGSHLVLPMAKLPVEDALTLFHPRDKRPVFIFPWEGTTVIGTTDLDHGGDMDEEPVIAEQEMTYLLEACSALFPDHTISSDDIISTWSGIRPVIGAEKAKDPSKERRDHAVWSDAGLVTVSGGKLTTFRLIALDAIKAALPKLGELNMNTGDDTIFADPQTAAEQLNTQDHEWAQRLIGRYGKHAGVCSTMPPTRSEHPSRAQHSVWPKSAGQHATNQWCIWTICCSGAHGLVRCWNAAVSPSFPPSSTSAGRNCTGTRNAGKLNCSATRISGRSIISCQRPEPPTEPSDDA